jgi:hypothetical protein
MKYYKNTLIYSCNENGIYGSKKCFKEQSVWNLLHNSVDYEGVDKFYVMGFFKPKEGWEAKGYKTFGGVPFLLDIVFAETSKEVDFIIGVKRWNR